MNVFLAVALLGIGALVGFMIAALMAIAADDKNNEKRSEKSGGKNEQRVGCG